MARSRIAQVALVCALACVALTSCASSPMRVTPLPAISPSNAGVSRGALIGKWQVTAVRARDARAALKTLDHPSIDFEPNGAIEGFDSVNSFSGRFHLEGNQLRVSESMASLVGLASSAPRALIDTQAAFSVLTGGKHVSVRIVGRMMELDCGAFSLTATRA